MQVENEVRSDTTSGRHETICEIGAIQHGYHKDAAICTRCQHTSEIIYKRIPFDSDSQPLMFDYGASASITNDLWDFMTKPTEIM